MGGVAGQKACSIGKGDVRSEDSLIREYDHRVVAIARRFHSQAEDLAQIGRIALLEAARAWESKPHQTKFWTYAQRAVLGAMIDHLSREVKRAAIEAEAAWEPSAPAAPDVALEAKEALAFLPKRDAALVFAHAQGEDVRTLAEDVDIAKSTMHDLLSRSTRRIRESA